MKCRTCVLALVPLLVLAPFGVPRAEPVASVAALLERYPKGEVIRVVVSKCGGDITVSQPADTRVYGRPREDLVTAGTIQTDMQRCRIPLASLEQKVQRSVDWSGPKGRVIRNTQVTTDAKLTAEQKKLEKEKNKKDKAAERARQKAERAAAREAESAQRQAQEEERAAAMLAEQERREADLLKRKCEAARERRDEYYESANEANYPNTRQRYRDLYEEEREWIRRNC